MDTLFTELSKYLPWSLIIIIVILLIIHPAIISETAKLIGQLSKSKKSNPNNKYGIYNLLNLTKTQGLIKAAKISKIVLTVILSLLALILLFLNLIADPETSSYVRFYLFFILIFFVFLLLDLWLYKITVTNLELDGNIEITFRSCQKMLFDMDFPISRLDSDKHEIEVYSADNEFTVNMSPLGDTKTKIVISGKGRFFSIFFGYDSYRKFVRNFLRGFCYPK